MGARFGPAGNSDSFQKSFRSSLHAPAWIAAQGLQLYEYQCGKGVNVGEETARKLGEQARLHGITLSLHAPYFINLANPEAERREQTIGYILAACRAADWMGAVRVVLHPGGLMKRDRAEALGIARQTLRAAIGRCDDAGFGHISLCPETMGKVNQLGDLDEVLALCELDERLTPCVDFGHLYARSFGAVEGEAAMAAVLDRMAERIGTARASRFHSHFSKIEFTPGGGEKLHLTFDQDRFGPDFCPLARQIAARGWAPTIICESAGTQAEDARTMQDMYRSCLSSQ